MSADRDLIAMGRRHTHHAADDLPEIACTRDVLSAVLDALEAASNRAAELEAQIESDRVKAAVAVLNLECEVSAAQRPPLRRGHPLDVSDFEDWLNYGKRGLSSETIVAALTGSTELPGSRVHVNRQLPADAGDFWRCEKLLCAVPEARDHLGLVAAESPEWASLVEHWDELVALDRDALTRRIRALTGVVHP